MEFQFRQRPLSLLIGFLLLPPAYAQQDAAATATTTAHRNPAEEATPHDLGPHYDHTSWEWPMPSPAMARRFWDKPACSPRRDRTSAGTAASSGPMVLPTRRSWKRMAARTPMPQRYPPMAASSSDTANYRQAPWWRPPGSMPPPTRRSNCTTASTQPRLGSDRSFRRRLGDHRQRGRIGRKPSRTATRRSRGAMARPWPRTSRRFQATPNSTADLISADGSVIAGSSFSGFVQHAVTWTNGSATATDLGVSYGQSSGVTGISANGAVIVGWSGLFNNHDRQAVSWTNGATSPTNLGMLEGGTESIATAVSADGSVIIGDANFGANPDITHAVSWSQGATTPTDLGSLHGYDSTTATALSANARGHCRLVILGLFRIRRPWPGSMAPRRPPPWVPWEATIAQPRPSPPTAPSLSAHPTPRRQYACRLVAPGANAGSGRWT